MKNETLNIYIGFDQVESVAWHTLAHSILSRASVPVAIHPVKQSLLPFYRRPRDPKQSNEFSFTRFLVPYLQGFSGWALFMDCDMLVRTDIKELFDMRDPFKSVMCVQHDYTPSTQTKYLGNVQYAYPRKNWSSVMLFNCAHHDCRRLTPDYVNTAPALDLHRMTWTDDERIGELPITYNWLIGEYHLNGEITKNDVKIVHWTIGGPWFHEYEHVDFADEWFEERRRMTMAVQEDEIRTVVSER